MANELSREQLQRLARLGAGARLAELEEERHAILRAFPGLAAQASRSARTTSAGRAPEAPAEVAQPAGKRVRRRKKMSADQRRAASERMRRFWAERRKAAEN